MNTVLCSCSKCGSEIGQLINLWTKIGKSYLSPVVDPDEGLEVQSHGAVREGDRGTLVEGCHLQDIVCSNCTSQLGLRCVATPVNHVLDENQVLLKLASVSLSDDDGDDVDFVIKRILNVREPSKVNSTGSFPGATNGGFTSQTYPEIIDLLKLQADLQRIREDINRIDSNGARIVSGLDKGITQVQGEIGRLKNTLGELRRDISGTQQDVASVKTATNDVKQPVETCEPIPGLEDQLVSAASSIVEVRQEVKELAGEVKSQILDLKLKVNNNTQEIESLKAHIKGSLSSRQHAKDMTAVLAELAQLRQHVDDSSSKRPEPTNTPFPSRELDILTKSIAKVGSRASQVENLQMELEIMKGRVERLEASRQSLNSDPRQRSESANTGELSLPPRRKRDSSAVEATVDRKPPPKRLATSSGYLETPAQSHDASPEPRDTNPVTAKLTKSGKIDRRSLRYRKPLGGTTK